MALADLLTALNGVSPLGVITLLAWIVYLLISKKGPVGRIRDNHLHDVTELLRQIAASAARQERVLASINDGINYLKGRIE